MNFGVTEGKASKPLVDINDPGVEDALKSAKWEAGGMRMGARLVEVAEPGRLFVFSDGTRTDEVWRSIIQVDCLPYDIAFGPKTIKAAAVSEAQRLGYRMGGRPLTVVKGATA